MDVQIKTINLKNNIDELTNLFPIEKIYLFGSRAYGTNSTRSDIDLIIVGENIPSVSIIQYHDSNECLDIFIGSHKSIHSPVTGAVIERRGILSIYKQLDAKLLWSKKDGYIKEKERYLLHNIYLNQSFLASAIPYSVDFLNLKREINNPDISSECQIYLNESLASYSHDCYTACVAMLGCAYECIINELINACEKKNMIDNPTDTSFESNIKSKNLAKQRMEGIKDYLKQNARFYKSLGFDKIDETFNMFDLIRQYRNNADHPSNFQFQKEYCEALFAGTVLHLKKIIKLISDLNTLYP